MYASVLRPTETLVYASVLTPTEAKSESTLLDLPGMIELLIMKN